MAQSRGIIAPIQPLCWSAALKHPIFNAEEQWALIRAPREKECMFSFSNSSLISQYNKSFIMHS